MRERRAAENFARAATDAGVRRIVYLGGLLPQRLGALAPPRLASRVEEVMLAAAPDSLALRASIVIAARSRSFRLLVRLVERTAAAALPSWRRFRTQPIDGTRPARDARRAADLRSVGERSIDVAGPDVLSYEEMLTRIADSMLIRRRQLRMRHGRHGDQRAFRRRDRARGP